MQSPKSAFGRKGIVAVGIPFSNATVAAVDVKLGTLMSRNILRSSDCLALCFISAGSAGGAGTSDAPLVSTGYDVLTLF
jgi:hypothetical protein